MKSQHVIAAALTVLASIACVYAFAQFVYAPYVEQQRRQEIIRREPWRELQPNYGF